MHPIHDRVLAFMDDPRTNGFEDLAVDGFAHQFTFCGAYRRYCLSRGRTPDSIPDWSEIPAVPVQAFKHVELCCALPHRTFLSTGTTQGLTGRARHLLPDLRLYHRSALVGLRTFLFPDIERLSLVSLVPSAEALPDSSLAQMVTWAIEEFGDERSAYAVDGSGIAFDRLIALLGEAERSGQPICLMTTTGALIRVIDYAAGRGLAFRLPHGSRLMDTGGDKGAPRHLSRNGLLHACWRAFAIPGYFFVNEYGMTELSSQFYDSVIFDRQSGKHRHRRKIGPHWTRTVVLDPDSLSPLPQGQAGLLCHFDLANVGTAMVVMSEDIGRAVDGGFELLGRATGAETRGCSLSAAEWDAA